MDAKPINLNLIIDNFDDNYWSRKFGSIFISNSPGETNSIEEDIKKAANFKISTILSLLEDHEIESLKLERLHLLLSEINIVYYRYPISDFNVPNTENISTLDTILSDLLDRLTVGDNVLIHCKAGLGRSGMISALLLKKFGMTADKAIEQVRLIKPGSIETLKQENFIKSY